MAARNPWIRMIIRAPLLGLLAACAASPPTETADIRDLGGIKIGKHYAGPTWEAVDGSKVTGELVARVNSADPNAIAWLLLRAKATSGDGIFGGVRFIQRLHTAGGNAPSAGCNQASVDGEVRVSYSADYWFYSAKP